MQSWLGPEGVFLPSEVTLPRGPSPRSPHQGLSSARSAVPLGFSALCSPARPTLGSTPALLTPSAVSPCHPRSSCPPPAGPDSCFGCTSCLAPLPARLPLPGSELSCCLLSILQNVTRRPLSSSPVHTSVPAAITLQGKNLFKRLCSPSPTSKQGVLCHPPSCLALSRGRPELAKDAWALSAACGITDPVASSLLRFFLPVGRLCVLSSLRPGRQAGGTQGYW